MRLASRVSAPRPRGIAGLCLGLLCTAGAAQEEQEVERDVELFGVVETSIAAIHRALRQGDLTARQLVEIYLARIERYDRRGPALGALIVVNPRARERADELDAAFAARGELTGPLHGIPLIVKDNYDTGDLPTSAGSALLKESIPPDDAFTVRKLREAGAIVLAKSNMAEWAFSPYHTVGSALEGHTRNPYDLARVPAGSSGGTAAAVAANLGAAGLGTDTGNSIRGPSSHCALVGIRPTLGLTSRDGIVPLYLDRDVGGPMARSVADAAAVLEVMAGYDPGDPWTEACQEREVGGYLAALDPDALDGARIGVLRQISDRRAPHPEILERFEEALEDLRAAGAEVVDPVLIEEQDAIPLRERWCPRFRTDVEAYLASLGDAAPVRTLDEIVASGQFHPSVEGNLRYFQGVSQGPEEIPACARAEENAERLCEGVRRVLEEGDLDALVYPTWSHPPRLIGDLESPHGDNSQDLAPHTGFPAITVPMGYVQDHLPVGLQFLGDAFSERELIGLAYAYEQATRHRRPPLSTPALRHSPRDR